MICSFFDDLRGYIVGGHSDGIILKTIDGGKTWLSTDFQVGLSSIYFINETTGFASGRKLFRTQDGGETWNEMDLGYFAYGNLNFFDGKSGFLAASNYPAGNSLLKTTDGGSSWRVVDNLNNIMGTHTIGKIQINNDVACLLSNGATIYTTQDKGITWNSIDSPILNSIHFINKRQAVGVGQHWYDLGYFSNGMLCITNDGGKSWEQKYFSPSEFLSINDIDFVNDSTALAIGNSPEGCVIKLDF
ncbi:MAG: YCF48-related protein [Paludibacter sp.]